MKKIILAILLIIIVAGTGIPFFNGIIVKKAVQQTFSNINKMYAEKGYKISTYIWDGKAFFTVDTIKTENRYC